MTNQNQSKHTSGLWQPEESWRSKVIGFWCGSTSARTTRFSAKPRSIGTARRSHGWVDCAWRLSILDASDKSNIVTEFLSAEIGVQHSQPTGCKPAGAEEIRRGRAADRLGLRGDEALRGEEPGGGKGPNDRGGPVGHRAL